MIGRCRSDGTSGLTDARTSLRSDIPFPEVDGWNRPGSKDRGIGVVEIGEW